MTDLTPADVPVSPAAITQPSVVAFFAADYVAAAPDGKLHVNGGFFSLLRFPSFPALQPTLGIGAVLEIPFHELMKDHIIRIVLRDPEDRDLPVQIEASFRSAPGLDNRYGDPNLVPLGLTVTNVQIPAPGNYSLVLWLDDTELRKYRIRVVQTPMVATQGSMHQPNY
jgi:hypothetical protein